MLVLHLCYRIGHPVHQKCTCVCVCVCGFCMTGSQPLTLPHFFGIAAWFRVAHALPFSRQAGGRAGGQAGRQCGPDDFPRVRPPADARQDAQKDGRRPGTSPSSADVDGCASARIRPWGAESRACCAASVLRRAETHASSPILIKFGGYAVPSRFCWHPSMHNLVASSILPSLDAATRSTKQMLCPASSSGPPAGA